MLNKVMLIGRLGADPEVRYMPSGDPIASLRLATTRRWKNKNGERQEETEWHRITFFGALAKIAGEYLKKGSQVYVEGRIKTEKYQKNGEDTYSTGIVGEELKMLDSVNANSSNNQAQQSQQPRPKNQQNYSNDGFDDDIPF